MNPLNPWFSFWSRPSTQAIYDESPSRNAMHRQLLSIEHLALRFFTIILICVVIYSAAVWQSNPNYDFRSLGACLGMFLGIVACGAVSGQLWIPLSESSTLAKTFAHTCF